jgi:hypothetical protein
MKGEPGWMRDFRLHALDLFLEVHDAYDAPELAERRAAMERMINRLEEYRLPPDALQRLLPYYERAGRYADAEDVLYELLAETRAQGEAAFRSAADAGDALYRRLLARTDAQLEAGGLPREEVEEGWRTLERVRADPDGQPR